MPQLNNNQYATLDGDEEDEESDNESTGVKNDSKITKSQEWIAITIAWG